MGILRLRVPKRLWTLAGVMSIAAMVLIASTIGGGTGLAWAAGSVSAGSTPGLKQVLDSDTDCLDVVVIGARGSGEAPTSGRVNAAISYPGLGDSVAQAVGYYAGRLPNYRIGWYAVHYPAAYAPAYGDNIVTQLWDLLAGFIANDYNRRTTFYDSIDTGVSLTENFLAKRAVQCPNEHYVLAGYSQGAMVMHRVLNRLYLNMTTSTSAKMILPRIDGGLAIADGDRVGAGTGKCFNAILGRYRAQGGIAYGTAPNCGLGVSAATIGTDGNTYLPKQIAIPNMKAQWPDTRWHDICINADIVCDTNLHHPLAGVDIHGNAYRTTGSGKYAGIAVTYVRSAIATIAKQTAKTKPAPLVSASFPAASSVVPGATYSAQTTALGGTSPYFWSLFTPLDSANTYCDLGVGALSSITISASTGLVHGVAACNGTTTFGVKVTDANGTWASGTVTVTVTGGPTSTPPPSPTPTPTAAPTSVISIGTASGDGLAVHADGTVWAWGPNNGSGVLGPISGTATQKVLTPVQVPGLSGITSVVGVGSAAYALKSDGTVWGWGMQWFGQNTVTTMSTPIQIQGLTSITAIAGNSGGWNAANGSVYALKSDGTVWAYGWNGEGERGDGTLSQATVPSQVSGLDNITAVAGGFLSGYALRKDGTVWAWGSNQAGELGNGTATNFTTSPGQVQGLAGATAIGAGGFTQVGIPEGDAYAVHNDGTLWAWGGGGTGALGTGDLGNSLIPVHVPAMSNVIAVAGGSGAGYAVRSDGTAWAWGSNASGQLGNGTTVDSPVPVQVQFLSSVKTVIGGVDVAYALLSDGTVWAWGDNSDGELGNGGTSSSLIPVRVGG